MVHLLEPRIWEKGQTVAADVYENGVSYHCYAYIHRRILIEYVEVHAERNSCHFGNDRVYEVGSIRRN